MPGEEIFGVATSHVKADVLRHRSNGTVGFYGTTPITKQTVAQLATTKTSTQLRAELTDLQNALASLGMITVT